MAKVILNKGFGGFEVSAQAHKRYAEKLSKKLFYYAGEYTKENGIVYTKVPYEEFRKKNTLFYFYSFKDYGDNCFTEDRILNHDDLSALNPEDLDLDRGHREDPLLIEVVEELGEDASGWASTLKVVEIPDELANGNYMIDDYDGFETLHAKVDEY